LDGTRLLWIDSPFPSDILDDNHEELFSFEQTLHSYEHLFITCIKSYLSRVNNNCVYDLPGEDGTDTDDTKRVYVSAYNQKIKTLADYYPDEEEVLRRLLCWSVENRFFLRDLFVVIRAKGTDATSLDKLDKWIFSDLSKTLLTNAKNDFLSQSLAYLIKRELEDIKTNLCKSAALRNAAGWQYVRLKNDVFNSLSPTCSSIVRMAFAMSQGICLDERVFWPTAAMEFYCYGRYFKPILSVFPERLKQRFQDFCHALRELSTFKLRQLVK